MSDPEAGDVIEGTGGLRKLLFADTEGIGQSRIGGAETMVKARINTKPARGAKRDLFAELSEGMEAVTQARKGKRTLRTHTLEFRPPPEMTPKQLIAVRRSLNLSRPLFAAYLRTNVRTLENWEQGRARNPTRRPRC